MQAHVNATRRYDSPRRREQAAATRSTILSAAQRLFEQQGYGATTIAQVAAEAEVATKTVYLAFETKSGLLRALWNYLLRGGDEEVPIAQQPWYREVLEASEPDRQLRLNARNSRRAKGRMGGILQVIRGAASQDTEIGALWRRIQSDYHDNQRAIVESIEEKGGLRAGLDVNRATDILWTINHPATWQLLVIERGWTADEYELWTAEAARRELLGSA
jgi:AcrR family transcriptional regulator